MKKKIKLRYLTLDQYIKWWRNDCKPFATCSDCPFINCDYADKNCWIYHKNTYSEEFLNIEIEVDIEEEESEINMKENEIVEVKWEEVLKYILISPKGEKNE